MQKEQVQKKIFFLMIICTILISGLLGCSSLKNINVDEQNTGVETGSVVESTTIEENNEVESVYNAAVELTKEDLTGSKSNWEYKGLKLLSEDCEWIDSDLNKKGTVNQGAIYRKMAMLLEGFQAKFNKYTDYAEILIGFVPDTREEFVPYAENAQQFICTKDEVKNVMKAFEKLDCVEGTFDYKKNSLGVYDFTINDTKECAQEMKISEEMLGYILAMLSEYAPDINFENNRCHIKYESLAKEKEPEGLGKEDFVIRISEGSKKEDVLKTLKEDFGDGGFISYYFDAAYDKSKEGVIRTKRNITIGSSKEEVIKAYGEGIESKFNVHNNATYLYILENDEATASIMRTQCSTYFTYEYEKIGEIDF
jgi:hypothetical protein